MKKTVLFFSLQLLAFSLLIGQNAISVGVFNNYTQNNLTIDFQRDFGTHHTLSAGIKIMQKINSVPDNVSPFRHRFYPTSFANYLGFDFNYMYKILLNSRFTPYLFDNLQFSRANVISDKFLVLTKTSAFENNIGIGFSLNVIKKISVFARGGVGSVFIPKSPDVIISGKWDISSMFGFGMSLGF